MSICAYIEDYEISCKYNGACRQTLLAFCLSCAVALLYMYVYTIINIQGTC